MAFGIDPGRDRLWRIKGNMSRHPAFDGCSNSQRRGTKGEFDVGFGEVEAGYPGFLRCCSQECLLVGNSLQLVAQACVRKYNTGEFSEATGGEGKTGE